VLLPVPEQRVAQTRTGWRRASLAAGDLLTVLCCLDQTTGEKGVVGVELNEKKMETTTVT